MCVWWGEAGGGGVIWREESINWKYRIGHWKYEMTVMHSN